MIDEVCFLLLQVKKQTYIYIYIYIYIYMLCMKRTNCENYFFPSQVYRALLKKTNSIPGAKVENNKFCLSVHFRCVDEKVNRNPALASFLHLFFLIIIIIIYLFIFGICRDGLH
jgi:hypothetical protein